MPKRNETDWEVKERFALFSSVVDNMLGGLETQHRLMSETIRLHGGLDEKTAVNFRMGYSTMRRDLESEHRRQVKAWQREKLSDHQRRRVNELERKVDRCLELCDGILTMAKAAPRPEGPGDRFDLSSATPRERELFERSRKLGFQLPPEITMRKESHPSGQAYAFRHRDLGDLGHVIVKGYQGQTLLQFEVAGEPDDPMTSRRREILEPLCHEISQSMDKILSDSPSPVPGPLPPFPQNQALKQLVKSQLIPCPKCGQLAAHLIFSETYDASGFEDYARLMYGKMRELNVPTWIVGPMIDDGGPVANRPADILKAWPEREPIRRLRPCEFTPILDRVIESHCGR